MDTKRRHALSVLLLCGIVMIGIAAVVFKASLKIAPPRHLRFPD